MGWRACPSWPADGAYIRSFMETNDDASRAWLHRLPFDRPTWPFPVQRVPLFYGWVVVVVGTLGVLCSAPGQTVGVSVFTDHLMAATRLTRVQLSLTYLVGTLTSAFLLPRAGRIYDRLGSRTMTVLTAFALGGALILLSQVDVAIGAAQSAATALAGGPGLDITIAFSFMALSFFALRFLGQGVLTMISSNMILKWFDQRRGLVSGLVGLFSSFGFSAAPVLFNWLIEDHGWKGAWLWLGLGVGLGLTVLAALLYRDNPEECGLRPDGLTPMSDDSPHGRVTGVTLDAARGTRVFWIFIAAVFMSGLVGTALPFHVVDIHVRAGLDRSLAIAMFLPAAVIAVCVHFVGGWISDRTSLRPHLVLFQVGMILANVGLIYLEESWGRSLMILGYGMQGGMARLLSSVTWPRYFGRRYLGAIRSYAVAFGVAASAVGPTIFGLSVDWFGTYHVAAWGCVAVLAVLLPLAPFAREPNFPQLAPNA